MTAQSDLRSLADNLETASAQLAATNPTLSAQLALDAIVCDQAADQIDKHVTWVTRLGGTPDVSGAVAAAKKKSRSSRPRHHRRTHLGLVLYE